MNNTLIFVYNADAGLFNTITDIAHKAFSPETYQCNLCKITHNLLSEKKEWTEFISSLKATCVFMHRNEFRSKYSSINAEYPAIFLQNEKAVSVIISASEINQCFSIEDLKSLLQSTVHF